MKLLLALSFVCFFSANSYAKPAHSDYLRVTITDITEKALANETPEAFTSKATPRLPLPATPTTGTSDTDTDTAPTAPVAGKKGILSGVKLSDLITLGQKVWDYILANKPNATYQEVHTSIVPAGITNWTQLTGWSKPIAKVYHVTFTDVLGNVAGGFDYRISFVYGGGYKGQGKYLGQLSFVPANIKLHTGRTMDVKAEISDPINFGSETAPIAAVDLRITWSSPTVTKYQVSTAEYFVYGSGEIDDLTNGTSEQL